MESFWPLFLCGLFFMFLVMTLTWVFSRKVNNYSIVDAVWSFSFFLISVFYFAVAEGWVVRRALVLVVVSLWAIRLSWFLARRIKSHHPHEDERYLHLRQEYGDKVSFRFFLFFMYQGISVGILAIPFMVMMLNQTTELNTFEIVGVVVVVLSLIGEGIADAQANRFKANPENRLKTCQTGLWKYSRHPNYFFESCVWWGFYIMALGTPGSAYTIFAPLTILFLLLKVTGVPPSEAQALKKRGDEYRSYQKRTSMFVPWFPKGG